MIPFRLSPLGFAIDEVVPLTLIAVTAGTVELHGYGTKASLGTILYRVGSGAWQSYAMNTQLPLSAGQAVQWMNTAYVLSSDSANYVKFILSGTFRSTGDCMSMLNWAAAAGYRSFSQLFDGCAGLTTAPEIKTATAGTSSLNTMFKGCTGLTAAPRIRFTALQPSCCAYAFQNCSNLARIEVDFSAWTDNGTTSWVSGVAASGTFIKPAALPEEYGVNRIPDGWTVVNK